ncbi:hypothetical protein C900_05400 [Fulvivirga imtechensis AK7]|uniref:Uncharacterized protein n=2 Tax=Fulvivirga TaxID=396811 RepID=L8JNX0_9BACT|nr:hypothetical protein C900_05400 [Fulvivirga imtechensis AK7]
MLSFIFLIACNGKKKTEDEKFFEKYPALKNASKIKNDTVIYDSDGNLIKVQVNPKTVDNVEKVNSVGGELFYKYKTSEEGEILSDSLGNKILESVFKHEYRNEFFEVLMRDDSVKVGEEFIGVIYGFQDDIKINIDGLSHVVTYKDLPFTYKVRNDQPRIYSFSGKIKTFGKEYPFEYKYVVVEADSLDRIQE